MKHAKTGATSIALLTLALTACSGSGMSGNGTNGVQAPSSIVGETKCTEPIPHGWGGSFLDYVADGDAGDPRDVVCQVTNTKGVVELIILDGGDGEQESTSEYYPFFDAVDGEFHLFLWNEGGQQLLGDRGYRPPRGYLKPKPGKYVPATRRPLTTIEATTGSTTGSAETDDESSDRRNSTTTGGSQRDDEPTPESSERRDDKATTGGSASSGGSEATTCKWKPQYVYDTRTRRYKWKYGWVC